MKLIRPYKRHKTERAARRGPAARRSRNSPVDGRRQRQGVARVRRKRRRGRRAGACVREWDFCAQSPCEWAASDGLRRVLLRAACRGRGVARLDALDGDFDGGTGARLRRAAPWRGSSTLPSSHALASCRVRVLGMRPRCGPEVKLPPEGLDVRLLLRLREGSAAERWCPRVHAFGAASLGADRSRQHDGHAGASRVQRGVSRRRLLRRRARGYRRRPARGARHAHDPLREDQEPVYARGRGQQAVFPRGRVRQGRPRLDIGT